MGIKYFFQVFGSSAIKQTDKDFKGKRIGIDVSYDIYRASLGMKNINGLTDSNGNPTLLLCVLLNNVSNYKKKCAGVCYIFDNPGPNLLKTEENKKRSAAKKKASDEMKITKDEDRKLSLEKRKFGITKEMINDVKKFLTLLGIPWVVAPDGYEAEHLASRMMNDKMLDTFISSDSDTIAFGGNSITRRSTKKGSQKGNYEEYKLSNILDEFKLTKEQLVHLCVVLGCDFAKKTRGIGIKTILKKGLDVKLNEKQSRAKKYFLSKCPFESSMIIRKEPNKKKLIDWLVNDKCFNRSRVEKILSDF